jgi:XTP/dITP diphosphohydrolase
VNVDILIGTGNPAKFQRYKMILGQFAQLNVLSLADVQVVPPIVEDGESAAANARKKARTYADATGLPTLSIDEAFTIPGLPPSEQPGTNVRRYLGREAADEALLAAFVEKARRLSAHERSALWTYAICLALPGGHEFCEEVRLDKMLTDTPSLPILPGYPLSSVLIDRGTGKTLRDLTPAEERQHLAPVYEKVAEIVRRAGL